MHDEETGGKASDRYFFRSFSNKKAAETFHFLETEKEKGTTACPSFTLLLSLQRPIRNAGVLARIFGGRGRPRSLMQNGEIAV